PGSDLEHELRSLLEGAAVSFDTGKCAGRCRVDSRCGEPFGGDSLWPGPLERGANRRRNRASGGLGQELERAGYVQRVWRLPQGGESAGSRGVDFLSSVDSRTIW